MAIVQRYKGYNIRERTKVLRTRKTGYNASDGVLQRTGKYTVDNGYITESSLFSTVDSAMMFIDVLTTKRKL